MYGMHARVQVLCVCTVSPKGLDDAGGRYFVSADFAPALPSHPRFSSHPPDEGLDEVHCALQWAQNSTTVFLGVKYATRWAAPGAIEAIWEGSNLSGQGSKGQEGTHSQNVQKQSSQIHILYLM